VQRCIRTGDIEEVGDTTHHTFFEMLGNWSLGDYFKKEAIEWSYEFLTKILGLEKERLAVSVFEGLKNAPKDEESAEVWKSIGIDEKRIVYLNKDENWWGPAGATGPCGPDTEMFYWKLNSENPPEEFDPEDNNWVEIWNDVLMQYVKDEQGNYNLAKQKNVDTGMGLERTIAILNGFEDNYLTDVFKPIIKKIQEISEKKYDSDFETKKAMRIIADHIKASVFILAEDIVPGASEQSYVLRRLIRRAIKYGRNIGLKKFIKETAEPVFEIYDDYEHIQKNKEKILLELEKEEEQFLKRLEEGIKKFEKITENKEKIDGENAFLLYQSYGFPLEITKELAEEKNIEIDEEGFNKKMIEHQKLSRTASAGKFKSGLADNSEATTKLHTATHLLHAALRKVLNDPEIEQKGSNITPERLRFDFNFPRKLTPEEIKKTEDIVNEKIQQGCDVIREEMTLDKAKEKGAIGTFEDKYKEKVSVYSIDDFTSDVCSGPHVENTSELGKFRIKKEESSSAGVRRIKAVLE
ncbi:MAG: alanine--tRNA ligase, partial [Minisyncoccales bacterium]